jgi:lipopolysaccharide transport system ATP-binding protein
MTNAEPIISLTNVGIAYRRHRGIFGEPFWALKDVSFDLYQGETLGIIGRNGAGKSTLLRLMAGIMKPDRGTFINRGYRASLLTLQLGFIPYLSGRENARLGGMFMGLRRHEIEAKLPAIKEFSELEDFFENPINTYSSGMNARLGFSVAFQADPDILLVDEVLGVGDVEFRQKSTRAMQEKIRNNKTVVFVSHSAEIVRSICHRVVWIENGVSQMEGTPTEVFQEYNKALHVR